MRQFKVKVYIDISNSEHVSALNSFLEVIGNQENERKLYESLEAFEKRTAENTETGKAKPRRTKREVAKVEETITNANTQIVENQKETVTKTSIKIEDVRALLAGKVKDHRQAIKDELTKLDAANVTSLHKKHYKDFTTFLKEL